MSANVGYATLTVIPSAKGFSGALKGEVSPHMSKAGVAGGAVFGGGMLKGFKPMIGALGAAMAGTEIVGFLGDAVNSASDLNEIGTALNQVFGKATGQVMKFGDGGAKALGMSKIEALQAAQTFGVYGKAAGLSQEANVKFSTSLASLGTDLASFYNTSPQQAMEALAAGLRGESEPLRQYGILLDDATLRQQALSMGLIKTTKESLTPQQKVLASQAVIMKQAQVAQGDFARTSGGLANQQRILSAQWADAKATLGSALLPAVTAVVTFFNSSFAPAMAKIGPLFSAMGSAIQPAIDTVKLFIGSITGQGADVNLPWANAVIDAGASVSNVINTVIMPALASFGTWVQTQIIPRFAGIAGAIQGFVGTALPIVSAFAQGLLARLQPLLPIIGQIFTTIGSIITTSLEVIRAVIERVTGIIKWAWQQWGTSLMNTIATIWAAILNVIRPALATIQAVIRTVLAVLKGDWSGAWNGIKAVVSGVWNTIKALISGAFNVVRSIIGTGLTVVKSLWSAAWSWVSSKISSVFSSIVTTVAGKIGSVVSTIRQLPGKAVSALGNIGGTLISAGSDLIGGFIRGIWNRAGELVSTIRSAITDRLPDFVKTALGIHSPSRVFMALGEYTAEGMAVGISNGAKAVQKAADGLVPSGDYSLTAGLSGSAAPAAVGATSIVVQISPRDLDGIRSIERFVAMARQQQRQQNGVTL